MLVEIDCEGFIYGKLIKNGKDVKGHTNVAWSDGYQRHYQSLTGEARKAVFVGKVNRLIPYPYAFGQGCIPDKKLNVFTL